MYCGARRASPPPWSIEERAPTPASSCVTTACLSSNALGQSAVFGTEALARLGLRLGNFQLMLQSSQFDGVAFDPFSFQKDGLASAEVDVGRR